MMGTESACSHVMLYMYGKRYTIVQGNGARHLVSVYDELLDICTCNRNKSSGKHNNIKFRKSVHIYWAYGPSL